MFPPGRDYLPVESGLVPVETDFDLAVAATAPCGLLVVVGAVPIVVISSASVDGSS